MSDKGEKQYGLIIPKKPQSVTPAISNVFGDDGGSDEDDGTDWVKKALKAEGEKHKVKKQTKLNMQKALKEDPTIYQYDEVYDDMERTKNQSKVAKLEDKRPKYIENLLKAADRRKKEQEHRIERMVQKEREAEGEMYADKESFVTSAYRAKLEEFKKLEEEEARMNRLEAIGDVTKQQDLSGFYRHLYEQTVDKPEQNEQNTGGTKTESQKEHGKMENVSKDRILSKETSSEDRINKEHSITTKVKKSRQYRQRILEADVSDSEVDPALKPQNEDKCTVSGKNESEDKTDPGEPEIKKQKLESKEADNDLNSANSKTPIEPSSAEQQVEEPLVNSKKESKEEQEQKDGMNAKEKLELAKKERSRIWEKRTVGPVFEAALQRYYARKAIRLSAA